VREKLESVEVLETAGMRRWYALQPGTPNRRTQDIEEKLAALGCDPIGQGPAYRIKGVDVQGTGTIRGAEAEGG